jgi:hypothetical protein
VYQVRRHLFPDAAFARQENLRVAAGGVLDRAPDRFDGGADAYEL